ncbi:MAG: hypothetical protein LBE13_01665 [Bacteroidales bacterium]|jgi:hypothetical protein|nr:hypothetical protein [Bacteroidales bacterium]
MKKIAYSLIGIAVVSIAIVNVYLNLQNNYSSNISLINLEASTGETGETGETVYKWSNEIDCPGWFTGDYHVCQINGYQNICTTPGYTTCTCKVNCD